MKRTFFFSVMLFALIFVGCKKDNNELDHTNNVAQPNSENFKNLRKVALSELTQNKEFEVDGTGNIEFTSKKGVKISIPESCLHISGQVVSGTVQVEFAELFEKDKLLTTNIATMGWDTESKVAKFLVTGGAFLVKLTQNGKEIQNSDYCNYELEIPAKLTGELDDAMKLWYGKFNNQENLIWEEVIRDRNLEIPTGLIFENEKYRAIIDEFGWVNIDRFYDNESRETTSVTIKVPSQYDGGNSAVYISYKEVPGLATAYYDTDNKLFNTGGYTLPIGLEVSVIFCSESNGKWAYAIKSITIAKKQQIEFLKQELKEATQIEFEKAILAIK
ncbi:hypothetical protein [Capnocytophaga canimorsus]|nr:hypothetical protein [Capnocytophaga canimorsus]CEN47829.1 conserved hypothetical protein [Capnocytophaga canimorsus]VEJ18738.1 Uncharacterised protein [Capnocytophaga canimorsus]